MSRFHQRVRQHLRDKEFAAAYEAMGAEIALVQALDRIREECGMTKEALADRMGRRREAVSRLLLADDANPTLETLIQLLNALSVTAHIDLRERREGEAPIQVQSNVFAQMSVTVQGPKVEIDLKANAY